MAQQKDEMRGVKNTVVITRKARRQNERSSRRKLYLMGGMLVLLGGIICVILGMYAMKLNKDLGKPTTCTSTSDSLCEYSIEAKRVKLPEFLEKIHKTYYKLHPDMFAWDNQASEEELRMNMLKRYRPYDPHPHKLKKITDQSHGLLLELKKKIINIDELTPRELRTFEQLKHYLQHNFGTVQDHYYNGEWMMGPNLFCRLPICRINIQLYAYGQLKSPASYKDLEDIIAMIMKHKNSINQYRRNIQLGVKAGMVRSIEDCKAGVDALKEEFIELAKTNKPEKCLDEWYTEPFQKSEFLDYVPASDLQLWIKNHKKTALTSIKEALVEGFGKPVLDLLNFLEYKHVRHCVPSSVSSGLASLPLDYVYLNGKPTKRKTTKVLPTGEYLDGRKSYKRILSFYTTENASAEEIFNKGKQLQSAFYKEIESTAKLVTNTSNTSTAVINLKKILNDDSQWHNEQKFPENESNAKAYKTCVDIDSAKKYCPVRYKFLKKWMASCREIMALMHPQFIYAFHITGERTTLPNCPIEIYPHFNPSQGTMFFQESDEKCSFPTVFSLPFFLKRYGPKYQEWSIVAHETRPGHHSQIQGMLEYFQGSCKGLTSWLDEQSDGSYSAFTEGWALYSENPIMSDDTDLYKDNPLQKYGMFKWQIWRALRLIIDTGLHSRGMKRDEALKLLKEMAWDDSDFAVKEVTRYQSCPGQATSYMIGRLTIMELREKTKQELGEKFSLKDFHYQLLSQGNAPLSFLRKYIEKYIDCVKKDSTSGICQIINEPHKKPTKKPKREHGSLNLKLKYMKSHGKHYA